MDVVVLDLVPFGAGLVAERRRYEALADPRAARDQDVLPVLDELTGDKAHELVLVDCTGGIEDDLFDRCRVPEPGGLDKALDLPVVLVVPFGLGQIGHQLVVGIGLVTS